MSTEDKSEMTAHLHRMVMPDHLCPYGLKSKDLLERKGFRVVDHPLRSREAVESFMTRHGVDTTPQTFVGEDETTYQPVVALFATAMLMALAVTWWVGLSFLDLRVLEWFVAFSMTLLGFQKLRDVESFSTMFLNYDLLARRWVRYAYIYPFAETGAGLLMIAGALTWIAAPIALFIGTIGAVSVFKAVHVEKRDLKCACMGGGSNVPLGFVSLMENLMMMGMGAWMLVKAMI